MMWVGERCYLENNKEVSEMIWGYPPPYDGYFIFPNGQHIEFKKGMPVVIDKPNS